MAVGLGGGVSDSFSINFSVSVSFALRSHPFRHSEMG